jgi:hypothetical protein
MREELGDFESLVEADRGPSDGVHQWSIGVIRGAEP